MQAVLNPEGSFVLIGLAARLAYAIGLHRSLDGFGIPQAELEQRLRVFWVMCIIEKSICIRIGRPSAISDEDVGVSLPPKDLYGEREARITIGTSPRTSFYPFRAMCTLSLIESKVFRELYTTKARESTPDARLQSISHLDKELQEWRDAIPQQIRPEYEIECEPENRFAILILHFGYYNCLTAMHRASVHHGSWTSEDHEKHVQDDSNFSPSVPRSTNSGPSPRVFASYALCISAARSTICLTAKYLDRWSDPRNCLILLAPYFPLTAFLTMFAHILQRPLDPRTQSDLTLMEQSLHYLQRTVPSERNAILLFFRFLMAELVQIVQEYVDKAHARQNEQEVLARRLAVEEPGERGPAAGKPPLPLAAAERDWTSLDEALHSSDGTGSEPLTADFQGNAMLFDENTSYNAPANMFSPDFGLFMYPIPMIDDYDPFFVDYDALGWIT